MCNVWLALPLFVVDAALPERFIINVEEVAPPADALRKRRGLMKCGVVHELLLDSADGDGPINAENSPPSSSPSSSSSSLSSSPPREVLVRDNAVGREEDGAPASAVTFVVNAAFFAAAPAAAVAAVSVGSFEPAWCVMINIQLCRVAVTLRLSPVDWHLRPTQLMPCCIANAISESSLSSTICFKWRSKRYSAGLLLPLRSCCFCFCVAFIVSFSLALLLFSPIRPRKL